MRIKIKAVGSTLTIAKNLVEYESDYSEGTDRQAYKRINESFRQCLVQHGSVCESTRRMRRP